MWIWKCQLEASTIDVTAGWQGAPLSLSWKITSGQRGAGASEGSSLFRNTRFTLIQLLWRENGINSLFWQLWCLQQPESAQTSSSSLAVQQGAYLQPQGLGWMLRACSWGWCLIGSCVQVFGSCTFQFRSHCIDINIFLGFSLSFDWCNIEHQLQLKETMC